MDEIKDVVHKIVKGCAQAGVEVPEVLAAFIARTIVERNETHFMLDRKMTDEKINDLIFYSIEKLVERDNPALETMKMQVDYDASFLKDDTEAQKMLRVRSKMIASHKSSILDSEIGDNSDFEALTSLYRKIFRFLLEFAPNSKSHDRPMEREVAAALESVFPRVGLKAFAQLSRDDKNAQLMELARIVLGIRLFNKDQGRGGAGLDNMDSDGIQLAMALSLDMDREVEFFSDACNKYQKAIIRAHLQKRRKEIEAKRVEEEKYAQSQSKYSDNDYQDEDGGSLLAVANLNLNPLNIPVNDRLIDRWSQELSNRRQYLGFLRTLQEEVHALQEKVAHCCEAIKMELENLKALVNNKTSVPKEIVYPRFDALGSVWIQLYEDLVVLHARRNTFKTLCRYRLSFSPTLLESFYCDTDEQTSQQWNAVVQITTEEMGAGNAHIAEAKSGSDHRDAKTDSTSLHIDTIAEAKDSMQQQLAISKGPSEDKSDAKGGDVTSSSGATLLSVHNTPDFMMLPLELQGYCPWTLVNCRGLLIPGKPTFGVIRYDNQYFVCDHEPAIEAFMNDPEYYLRKIRERSLQSPEYIHLLRLQRWFPKASIARLLEQTEPDPILLNGKPATRDVGTGTPTHFVESNIDVNYHWNEWELRRRALKVVNLQKCVTKGAQTDSSHFRRDNDSQVYLLKEQNTQTRREKGTNPPIVTTYIAGLRGKVEPSMEAVSRYVKKPEEQTDGKEHTRPRVVTLKLDL